MSDSYDIFDSHEFVPEGADQAKKDAYAQQEILRQIAWETVSKYPHAGIAK